MKTIIQSTGNKKLDSFLGGLHTGDNVVWHDESGSLASDFFFGFMNASFKEDTHVVYVSFDRSPKNLLKKLGKLSENPLLSILDCFSYGKGRGSELFLKFYKSADAELPVKIIPVKRPEDPDTLAETLETVYGMCGGKVNYIFESLTGMQDLWGGEESVLKFYTRTCPRLYELNTIAYWAIEHSAHTQRLRAGINQIAQVVMALSLKRGKSFLTISKAEGREPENLNMAQSYWVSGGEVVFGRKREQTGGKYDLGSRIRSYRTVRGLSQTELARQVGVTPSTISQVESGQIYPSIPALLRMGELLSVDMASFFAARGGECDQILFGESDAQEVNIPGITGKGITIRALVPENRENSFEPYLIDLQPGAVAKSHFFKHKGEEFGYLVSGKLMLRAGMAEKEIEAGTFINLSYEMPSMWKNSGSVGAKLLWIKIKR